MQEKVSIIIPTYGRPDHLSKAIDSVLSQSYHNWELIIVDDNDPKSINREKTESVMNAYSSIDSVYYLKHERNKNGAAARNTGISFASGDYITFLDDDDEYFPERIQQCVTELENSDIEYGGVYTGCKFFRNGHFYRNCEKAISGNFLVETLSTTFNSYSGSNLFFRASVVKELRGFDESFARHQDYEFLVRFFLHYKIVGISKILMIKNENGDNLPDVEKLATIKEQYLDKYATAIEQLSDDNKRAIMFSNYIGLAQLALETNKKELYKLYYKKASEFRKPQFGLVVKFELLKIMMKLKSYGK